MMSRIFCCNPTILKKNLTRYWPIMAFCAFIGFMLLPMTVSVWDDYSVARQFKDIVSLAMPLLIFAYAPLCAACVFGYLHKSRSSNMLHAFPVTRDSLFMSNLLSGLAMFVLPWLGVCLVTLFLFLSNGIHLGLLLATFVIGTLEFLFFFAVAVFSMLLCGKTVYGILIYLFLQVGLGLMELLIMATIEPFLYGIEVGYTMLCDYLPLIYALDHPAIEVVSKHPVELCYNWGMLAILGGLGIGFLALAWLLYRKRHMEHCGDPIAYPRIQPVVLVVVSLFISLALGLFITAITFAGGVSAENAMGMHIAMLVGGFIGFFGVEMLLRKTTRVFKKKTFIGYGLFALVLSLGMLCVRFDWLNIVCYVPESDCVVVEFSNTPIYYGDYISSGERFVLTDKEAIAELRAIHQKIVDNRETAETYSYTKLNRFGLRLTYTTKTGAKIVRNYYLTSNTYSTAQQDIYEEFEAFMETPAVATSYLKDLELCEYCGAFAASADGKTNGFLTKEQFAELREAMQLDAQAGNLDVLTLLSKQDVRVMDTLAEKGTLAEHCRTGYLMEANYLNIQARHSCFGTLYIPETATHTYALLTELLN